MSRWPSHRKIDSWIAYRIKGRVSAARTTDVQPIEWGLTEDRTLDIVVSLAVPVKVKKVDRWPIETSTLATNITQASPQTEFDRQKEAFKGIPPLLLAPYQNQFVASRNGHIVDSDNDLAVLIRRFREVYGRVPVYVTSIGKVAKMPTPFVR